jgi:hypothetical protein
MRPVTLAGMVKRKAAFITIDMYWTGCAPGETVPAIIGVTSGGVRNGLVGVAVITLPDGFATARVPRADTRMVEIRIKPLNSTTKGTIIRITCFMDHSLSRYAGLNILTPSPGTDSEQSDFRTVQEILSAGQVQGNDPRLHGLFVHQSDSTFLGFYIFLESGLSLRIEQFLQIDEKVSLIGESAHLAALHFLQRGAPGVAIAFHPPQAQKV